MNTRSRRFMPPSLKAKYKCYNRIMAAIQHFGAQNTFELTLTLPPFIQTYSDLDTAQYASNAWNKVSKQLRKHKTVMGWIRIIGFNQKSGKAHVHVILFLRRPASPQSMFWRRFWRKLIIYLGNAGFATLRHISHIKKNSQAFANYFAKNYRDSYKQMQGSGMRPVGYSKSIPK